MTEHPLNGTLTITGDITALARVAEFAASLDLPMSSESPGFGGWTVESATILIRRLAPKQFELIDRLVRADGACDGAHLRDAFGDDLRGLTGPISKHIKSLKAEGLVPEEAVPVAIAEADPHDRVNRRTSWIRMPQGLVPIIALAIRDLGAR
jgi:hypothetical protein